MTPHHGAALALSLAVLAGAAFAAPGHPPWRSPASPGLRSYRYEVIETANGQVEKGYRADFDLKTGRDGVIDARVLTAAETSDGKVWAPVAVTDDCKHAMHAPPTGLASVRLWPVKQAGTAALGAEFLADCAPDAVFLPLTDILNVAIIPVAPNFKARALRKVGDRATYDGFNAAFNRSGRSMKETSPGGEVSLASVEGGVATIDWAPALADLDLLESGPQNQTIGLKGTEHFAFRVQIDTRTGALISGRTTYDDLDLAMHLTGVPDDKLPRQKITRAVTILPR